MMKINIVKLISFIFLGLFIAGCSGEKKNTTDLKDSQSSISNQNNNNDMLNFSAEVLESGKKLPNIYENKEQKYSVRYSADLDNPSLDEDGDAGFSFIEKEKEDASWSIDISVSNESDRLTSLLSAKIFSEAVVKQIKKEGKFDDVQAVRYEKNKQNDVTMFFLETKIKHKSQIILLQQYYLIHKDRTAVFTGSFSDEEGMKRFGRDMQSMVSSFKFEK